MPAPPKNPLARYRKRRDFLRTPEPEGKKTPVGKKSTRPVFVVHRHAARRLHYDIRLESEGVLKSWAVPKGPSLDPTEKRLAVRTEDHPLEYGLFEGVIPEGQYGAGTVIIWDKGTYENRTEKKGHVVPLEEGIENGHISFYLHGKKLRGGFSLTRFRTGEGRNWLLVKKADEWASAGRDLLEERPESVASGKKARKIGKSGAPEAWESEGAGRVDPELLQRAMSKLVKRPQPSSISPMLARIATGEFPGEGWLFEPKFDGERCIAFRKGRSVRLVSRNGIQINGNYPEIAAELQAQAAPDFIADGEIVAFEGEAPSFSKLQPRMQIREPEAAARSGIEVFYYLFDLLYFDGHDLRALELLYRKEMLRQVLSFGGHIRLAPDSENGEAFFRDLCGKGWEGVLAKRASSPYIGKRSGDWLKFKCLRGQEFVIGGFTEPKGARTAFGALLLGYYEAGRLRYAGKVGTGFDKRMLERLGAELRKLEQGSCPFEKEVMIREKGVHFVRPVLVAEVVFAEWTAEGLLRQPRFKGIRRDKAPEDVSREPLEGRRR